MAAENAQKELNASILVGSDELFDISCQPCSTESLNVEASSYCQECCEYLCGNCCKTHRKFAATKHHTMVDKSAISKVKLQPKTRDLLTETCLKHKGKVLEYFCDDHSQLCCGVCINLHHRPCQKVLYVPEVSSEIANSHEYKRLRADLDRLLSAVTNQCKKTDNKSQASKRCHSKALADIKSFRQQINKLLDELEDETTKKISQLDRENSEKIKVETDTNRSIFTDVKSMIAHVEEKVTSQKENQLYIEMKMIQARLPELESESKAVDGKLQQYSFHLDEKQQQMMSTLSTIWKLSLKQDNTKTTAKYVREVNVKSDEDKEECLINGMAVLTGNRIVITDCDNKYVKLVDMKTNTLTSRMSLSSKPFDITEIKPNTFAVAFKDEKKIQVITVSNVLTRSHTIYTPGAHVVGLCYDGSRFITACQDPGSVKIIDMTGRTLDTFANDSNGKQLFTKPRYIAVSRDKIFIYVTDQSANTVTCMTANGNIISVYKHDLLNIPVGVTVGKDDAVYVCSWNTHTVHQLSPTGDHMQILLGQDQDLSRFPGVIEYDEQDEQFYISSCSTLPEKRNCIRLYQLE